MKGNRVHPIALTCEGGLVTDGYRILFGDIHNHNALGYGVGSLERSIDVARTHLDFFAFTGHSSWHDLEPMEGGREQHWLKGFEKLKQAWPTVQRLTADADRPDEFCSFLGFEWHSSGHGDQCVIFPDHDQPIGYAGSIAELRRFCLERSALMIPHHLAYPTGMRGVNWADFDEACTPVVEIFSEHGNSEEDRGGFPFFNHSMGGRVSANTARDALDRGLRFGFVASSDSHNAFPGAYEEGLLAVLATDLTRPAILEAINARRTYALTGDRIEVGFTVDGRPMGSTIRAGTQVEARFDVRGRDALDVVELIRDGEIVHRAFPAPDRTDLATGGPVQVRLEWGWGPWGDLALDRVAEWTFDIQVAGGRIRRAFPCLRSGPFAEERRHRFTHRGDTGLAVESYTARRGAYRTNPNQSVVLELDGNAETALTVAMSAPAAATTTTTLADLAQGSRHVFTGPFPKESWQWHRVVPHRASSVAGTVRLPVPHDRRSYLYLRARQMNGQIAWASPVFMNYA